MEIKKNLVDADLKQAFKDCLLFAIHDGSNPDKRIKFKFKDFKGSDFDDFCLDYFAGYFKFNDVSFFGIDIDIQIEIILHNMGYNHFALVCVNVLHGSDQCHGHGDFWGTDHYTFLFYRFKDSK